MDTRIAEAWLDALPQVVVFEARDLTKVYRLGKVEVHALRGVDLDRDYVEEGASAKFPTYHCGEYLADAVL